MSESPTILIVDDEHVNTQVVRRILAGEGFHTLVAADGPSAVRLTQAEQPDLILLDVLMPGENGFEICHRLKSDPATADIPIIFLSALDDVCSKVTGLKGGGVDFLTKPVHAEEVLARVRVHLRIRASSLSVIAQHRAQLEKLRNAQRSILVSPAECSEAAFGVCYRPLEDVGGDFYDVLPVAHGVFAYFVADISGHGVSASFLTSAIKALLRQYAGPVYSPEDTLRSVDSVMRQMLGEEQYLTACYARLNRRTRRLAVVSAGHPPLILVSASGNARVLDMHSEPLGLFSSMVLQRRDVKVEPGDRFFMYSDGLIESMPGGGRKEGLEKLIWSCVLHRADSLDQVARAVVDDLRPPAIAATDDMLLLVGEV
jgi:sigma-B regulation protein RsbU (phosphoserine phosphatase)